MQGVILAAGYGTRLKPLTDNLPKALVLLKGQPLLYYAIKKLISFGIDDIIINTHCFADKIENYLQKNSTNSFRGSNICKSLKIWKIYHQYPFSFKGLYFE